LQPIVLPLKDEIVRDVRGGLWLLFGGMAVLLLVACANVSNLFLLRAESRAKEMAVRIAIGGSPRDLFRLLMREALFLSVAGAAVGLPLALSGLKALAAFAPVELPRIAEVQINFRVLVFTSAVVLMTALLFSLLSYFRHSEGVALDLKKGGRTRGALIAAQVALALNLLVGAALMLQSFQKLTDVERGFESTNLLTVEIGLPSNKSADHQRIYADLLQRTRSLPGVLGGAAASSMPLTEGGYSHPLRVVQAEATPGPAESPVSMKFFTPGYFQTMKVAVLQGATFDPGAPSDIEKPVAVSESLARRLFPGASPIGKKVLRLSSEGKEVQMFDPATRSSRGIAPWTIASVVADVREKSLRRNADEVVYIPLAGRKVEESIVPTNMTLVMHFAGDPSMLTTSVRRTVSELDPALSVGKIRSMDAIVGASIARERFMAFLLLAVSSVSTLLGAVGISSVVAHAARRRRKEVGIRVALGAQVAHIVGLGVRGCAASVVAGLGLGIFLSYATTQTLQSLLFEVSATDAFTVIGVAFLLLTIAFVASFVPALKAALVDPMTALRNE
jgi:putative ABC transport system permease protein